jgi:hypothetical protein
MITRGAFFDESFSSYVFRVALRRQEFPLTPVAVNRLYYQNFLLSSLDPDYDINSDFTKECLNALDSIWPDEGFSDLFTPYTPFVMPRYFRRSYCFDCLCDQLQTAWSPGVLKRWGLIYYCVCNVHRKSLFDANYHLIQKANAAHDFFYFHTEQRIGESARLYSTEAQHVTLEVQRVLKELDCDSEALEEKFSLLEFCRLFLEILLFPRFGICNVPSSSKGVPVQAPVWQQSYLGPFLATVFERQSAMLLLGWILDVPGANVHLLPDRIGVALAHEDKSFWWLGMASSYLPDNIFRHHVLQMKFFEKRIELLGVREFIGGFISRH